MTLIAFTKLIVSHWKTLLLSGLLAAAGVYYLTQGEKKEYASRMVINTGVVSGYNIENHDSDSRIDRDYTRNELENLISLATAYETQEELAIQLMADYIRLEQPDPQWVLAEHYQEMQELWTEELRHTLVDSSRELTIENIRSYKAKDRSNVIYQLMYSDHPFFGIEQLQRVRVNRKGASDLLEFSYSTVDPAVCRQTLSLLADIFMEKYRLLKANQSEDVLSFFAEATQGSAAQLSAAEEKLLAFQVENNIINYYEQTRFIADKKEDLDELFFQEVMDLEATRSSLQRIEEQMQGRVKMAELNQLFLDKRAEISRLANGLAVQSIGGSILSNETNLQLKERLRALEGEIQELARNSFKLDQTPEGVSRDQVLNNWLQAVIKLEQAGARLKVIKNRKQEFKDIYGQFAPWGSSLKKIEREIALAEDAYLENLHSYNQARLHLQNTTMAGNLHLLDAPFYPTKEGASKRILLIAVAFLAGIILPLTIIVVLVFLDQTLKDPQKAAEIIGLPLIGAYPVFPCRSGKGVSGIDFATMRQRSTRLIQQNLFRIAEPNARLWAFTSTRGKEGVSFVLGLQAEQLRQQGKKVLVLLPESKAISPLPIVPNDHNTTYHPDQLPARLQAAKTQDWDYILVELPYLLSGVVVHLHGEAIDQGVLVCQSSRIWTLADQSAVTQLNYLSADRTGLILNGTPIQGMETVLGEVPRNRSRIRVWAKRLLSLNFSTASNV